MALVPYIPSTHHLTAHSLVRRDATTQESQLQGLYRLHLVLDVLVQSAHLILLEELLPLECAAGGHGRLGVKTTRDSQLS